MVELARGLPKFCGEQNRIRLVRSFYVAPFLLYTLQHATPTLRESWGIELTVDSRNFENAMRASHRCPVPNEATRIPAFSSRPPPHQPPQHQCPTLFTVVDSLQIQPRMATLGQQEGTPLYQTQLVVGW